MKRAVDYCACNTARVIIATMGRNSSYGRGRGRGGRSGGRGSGEGKKDNNSMKKKTLFYPHSTSRQHQGSPYETVKDMAVTDIIAQLDKGAEDVAKSFDLEHPIEFPMPSVRTSTATDVSIKEQENKAYLARYGKEMQNKEDRESQLRHNLHKAYAILIRDYCSEGMGVLIREHADFATRIKNDPFELLKEIRTFMHAPVKTKYVYDSLLSKIATAFTRKQGDNESLHQYYEAVKSNMAVVESHLGKHFLDYFVSTTAEYGSFESDASDVMVKTARQKELESNALERLMAIQMIQGAKSGTMLNNLREQFALGNQQYPTTLSVAYDALKAHQWESGKKKKDDKKNDGKKSDKNSEEGASASFAQKKADPYCYCCGAKDHKSPDCPQKDSRPKSEWVKTIRDERDKQFLAFEADYRAGKVDMSQISGWSGLQVATSLGSDHNGSGDFTDKHLLLDSGTTVDLIVNPDMLSDIVPSKTPMELRTNSGRAKVDYEGHLPNHGTVRYFPAGVANVLGLRGLLGKTGGAKCDVWFDSRKEDAFFVKPPNGPVAKFAATPEGLYSFRVPDALLERNRLKKQQSMQFAGVETSLHVDTVTRNMEGFSERQRHEAKAARVLTHQLGSPSKEAMKLALDFNYIRNCPVKSKDLDIAEKIYGPPISTSKGRMTKKKPSSVRYDTVAIPRYLLTRHRQVELCWDVMFVNAMMFLATIDRSVRFRSMYNIAHRDHDTFKVILQNIVSLYNDAGFEINVLHCDNEFEAMKQHVKDAHGILLNLSNPGEHQSDAERNNRTLRERIMAAFHRLPYKRIPKVMLKYLCFQATAALNYLPAKGGISKYWSPHAIMHHESLDYNKHFAFSLGEYVLARPIDENNNTHAIDCVYLRPFPGSLQGTHELLNLSTGKTIKRGNKQLESRPITTSVMKAVDSLAARDGMAADDLKFTDRDGNPFLDADLSVPAGVVDDENEMSSDDDDNHNPDDEESDQENDEDNGDDSSESSVSLGPRQSRNEANDGNEGNEDDDFNPEDDDNNDEQEGQEEEDLADFEPEEEPADVAELEEQPPRRSGRVPRPVQKMNLASTIGRSYLQRMESGGDDYTERLDQCHNITAEGLDPEGTTEYSMEEGIVMARIIGDMRSKVADKNVSVSFAQQYLLKKGLIKFGEAGRDGAVKEMTQLHQRECFTPISVANMTASEKKKAMDALMFLTEKRDGTIKGRMVYNGKPTREWLSRDDAASPTAALESIMLTGVIDAKECRDVMTADIPNAFIQTPLPETKPGEDRVIMKITGVLVDLLVDLDPDLYGPFVVFERGVKTLYVRVLRAAYGMLVASLLWYKKWRHDLESEQGFKFNPYDPCVANRVAEGSQHTIVFHVDDLKSSHRSVNVNDEFAKWLQKKYGAYKDVPIKRGKRHEFLGMILDFSRPGILEVDMVDYAKNMLEEFSVKFDEGTDVNWPAVGDLFDQGQKEFPKLGKQQSEEFHTFVLKGLFLSKRARPDIQPTIAFLCTRVKEPNEGDWRKLVRLMKYLYTSRDLTLKLSADDLRVIKWYVDAAFAVHADFKSHTGGVMTLGRGAPMSLSRKQKLNTTSSTAAELVADDDLSVYILWTMWFMEAQGYSPIENKLVQDNKSTMQLLNNGRKSAGKRTRALNIRYFFLADLVEKGHLSVEFCPTESMWADFMTKPLTGELFLKFRRLIMGEDLPDSK